MMLLKLAWRNIFRNRRRTLLSGLAVGIGLASLIFTDALMIGMIESMIRSATDTFLGEAQIHAEGYRDTLAVEKTIHDLDAVLKGLDREDLIRHYTIRVQAFSMVTSPSAAYSVLLYGIDPSRERDISKLDDAVIEGKFLDADSGRLILIGSDLADRLEVGTGDRLVITTARAEPGELAQEMFRVGGIFRFSVKEMDSGAVFITIDKARRLLGLEGRAHEIVLSFRDVRNASRRDLPFWQKYSRSGNEALGWRDLLRELDVVLNLSNFTKYIVALILFGIVSLIVLNTLFTSLYERLFEFGILRAVGTRPAKMALIILLEAASLSVISGVFGIILGLASTYIFSVYGIDYRGIEFADVTFRELIYPVFTLRQYIEYPLWILAFSLIAGTYPAVYTARITPARVLRKSM